VDDAGLARDAVVDDRVEPAREVDLQAVGQVAAVVEPQREHRVTRLEEPEVHGHVRLRPRVRLDVRVLGAEQLLRTVDRELLDLVHDLAAAVVAVPGISLGVLVREDGAGRLEDRRPREVLRRDQLDLPALAVGLAADQRCDLGIVLREPPGPQTREVVGGNCHSRDPTRLTAVTDSKSDTSAYVTRRAETTWSSRRSTRVRSAPYPPTIRSGCRSRAATKSFPTPASTTSRPVPGRA